MSASCRSGRQRSTSRSRHPGTCLNGSKSCKRSHEHLTDWYKLYKIKLMLGSQPHYAFHATSSVTKWHEEAKLISTQIALLCGLSLKQAVELKRCRCLGGNCEIRRWWCFREDLPQTTYLLTHFNVLQHRGNNFFLDLPRNNYVWQLLVGKTAATPAPTTKTGNTKLMPRSLSRWKAGTCRSSVNFRSTKTQY